MKDLAAVILNFLYDISHNTYLAVVILSLVPILLNSSLRKLSMRNLSLEKELEPEIAAIHDKYGYNNSKSQQKLSEMITKYNYIVYASIFLSLLQFLEGWAFMSGFKSSALYPVMVEPDKLQMFKSIRQMWIEGSEYWPYVLGILFVAMLLQRINDDLIEKHLIGDQVLADYLVLAAITVASVFIPAYIAVYWIATELIELVITIRALRKPVKVNFADNKRKKKSKK